MGSQHLVVKLRCERYLWRAKRWISILNVSGRGIRQIRGLDSLEDSCAGIGSQASDPPKAYQL
jgi:hypothetical protein